MKTKSTLILAAVLCLVGCSGGNDGKLEDAKTADASYMPKATAGSQKPSGPPKAPGKMISPNDLK